MIAAVEYKSPNAKGLLSSWDRCSPFYDNMIDYLVLLVMGLRFIFFAESNSVMSSNDQDYGSTQPPQSIKRFKVT